MVRRDLAVLLLSAVLAGAPLPLAAAGPDDAATVALTEASKLLQKGGYVKAIEAIDTILRSGKVPAELAARALLVRAEANEKLDRNVNAYADYNAALWMENLSAADRKRAEEGHGRLAKALGMDPDASPSAPPKEAAAPGAAPAKARAAAASPGNAGSAPKRPEPAKTAVQEAGSAQQTSSSGGDDIGNFFSNLFSSSPASPAPAPGQAAQSGATAQPKASEPSSTAALVAAPSAEAPQGKKPAKAAAKTQLAAQQAPAAAAPSDASGTGKFAIQLAAIGEEDKAIAEADRIGKKYAVDFGGRKPSLMIVPTNDGGTLYKVVVAPFETRADGQAACEQLKTKGLTCMVVVKK